MHPHRRRQNSQLKANSDLEIYSLPTLAEIRRTPLPTLLCIGFIGATRARFNETTIYLSPFDMKPKLISIRGMTMPL